ncbi:NAD(P)H-binding protein [Streptacidiphilus neutrinimicus]|uniref:NAD(P)H-binding protein n=1 Tax=Streptacidiphilus neutrinimicus TaxID=105420 RepID=UPI0005AA4580|nr:NAD(P)H-binding protein [Streptacidiphilus neutrinimicus]
MNESDPVVLVLGATGKTGSRVVAELVSRGVAVRTATRSGADVSFDWSDRGTYAPALKAVDRVYLIAPVMRLDFAEDVSAFLDEAEAARVEHVTFVSAYGMENAPQEVATRGVELDLMGRRGLGHTILRPAWFMQNFSETFCRPVDGAIVVPTGSGAEAFVDAEDVAAVAATTLADPAAHTGAAYDLTGPEALTVTEAAAIISEATGRTIVHHEMDREAWVAGAIADGIPPEYGAVLRQLTETIASGNGARPNDAVKQITGRPPRTFRDFARKNTAAWKDTSK